MASVEPKSFQLNRETDKKEIQMMMTTMMICFRSTSQEILGGAWAGSASVEIKLSAMAACSCCILNSKFNPNPLLSLVYTTSMLYLVVVYILFLFYIYIWVLGGWVWWVFFVFGRDKLVISVFFFFGTSD